VQRFFSVPQSFFNLWRLRKFKNAFCSIRKDQGLKRFGKVWQIKARFNLALSCGFMILFNHINHTSNWKLLFICLAKYLEFLTLFLVVWLLAAFSVSFLKMMGLNWKYLKKLSMTRKISQEVSSYHLERQIKPILAISHEIDF